MNEPIQVLLNEPIADITTDSININGNYAWSVQFGKNGIDTNPIITIEHSVDGVNFTPYSTSSTLVELVDTTTIFMDKMFATKALRFVIDKNGATTGDITVSLMLKDDN